jgi:hypothetical protein
MKRSAMLLSIALICAGMGRAAYRIAAPTQQSALSRFVPPGALLYLEAKDFASLLNEWNTSPQKRAWIRSESYEVFSRSRLFLRLKGAGDQFAAAAGIPPDMDFASQVAGEHSALALYDIGKLQFLYITFLPSARSMQTRLWQTRANFETRNAAGTNFYVRRDPESQREVAFAVAGDHLLLATREDLIADALQLMAGKQGRTLENEQWWAQTTSVAGPPGDVRMVLDMQNLVPNGYFRTYWVQQNITELSQYSAAVSDLFRSTSEYREERLLIRKKEPAQPSTPESLAAVADLSRLIPEDAGLYVATANPSPSACFNLLETKLLAPHAGSLPPAQSVPQVQLTSGEQGSGFDLETRINQTPSEVPQPEDSGSQMKSLLNENSVMGSLLVQSSRLEDSGVFVRIHSVIVLEGSSEWKESEVQSGIVEFVAPTMTASGLGLHWLAKSGYQEVDGLWPLFLSVRGKYLVISDDAGLLSEVLARFLQTSTRKPMEFFAGFNHSHERQNFSRLANLVDGPAAASYANAEHQPQFFSGNTASLSGTLADVSSEQMEVRSESNKVRQTVKYEWSR